MTPGEWIAAAGVIIPLWGIAKEMGEMKKVLEVASKAIEGLEQRVRSIEDVIPKRRGLLP